MEIISNAKKNRDVSIMINLFHNLNEEMYLPINRLEQKKVEIEYMAYLAFLTTYIIQIYKFMMINILQQLNEQTNITITEYINKIENEIIKNDCNTPIYNGLGSTITMNEIVKEIMDNFGEEYDMLFGSGKIDSKYFKPLTSKLLYKLTRDGNLDDLDDYIADTLLRFTYTYISAWS